MVRPVDRTQFAATGPDGRPYKVRAYQMRDDSRDAFLSPPSDDPDDWEFETADEQAVIRLGRGEYLLVDGGLTLLADSGP